VPRPRPLFLREQMYYRAWQAKDIAISQQLALTSSPSFFMMRSTIDMSSG
jgi:hypothetical protein